MNKKAYLKYALNKNGDLVHIDDVPNGNECGCFCPHCKSELCAKNGGNNERRVHHFAHLSGADCVGAIESALHKMAKDIMMETLCIQLPDRLDGKHGEQLKLDRLEVEFYDKKTRLRPDCVGYYGNKVIWIEFKRTHAVDKKKKGKIISAKIDCVEIDINACELEPNAVRKFITTETRHRIWIRDTNINSIITYKSNQSYLYCERNYDCEYYRDILRVFAKDDTGLIVNLLEDEINMNIHNYYCLVCGKELTLDINEFGFYKFIHVDDNIQCKDDLYLYEAAKNIIQHKFINSDKFNIVVPQYQNCSDKANCIFYEQELCSAEKNFLYDLKLHGYTECIKDYKLQNCNHKCDLIIKNDSKINNSIIINIDAGNCHIDESTEKYRIIKINVYDESTLLSLWNDSIGKYCTYINFKYINNETAPSSDIKREILKFSLFSSGKYHIDTVHCTKVYDRKYSTVLEYIFIDGVKNNQDAKLYSLLKCYKQKRKVCLCEICWFHAINSFYGMSETICKRYKTKGTPHYPLEVMPIECPYFIIDKEIENMEKNNFGNVKVEEKIYQK